MASISLGEVPTDTNTQTALRLQSLRTVQRMSKVARGDIIAYNPKTGFLQVWVRKDGRNQVIINKKIEFRDEQHFFDTVLLIGQVAQLPCTEKLLAPAPWWLYQFI